MIAQQLYSKQRAPALKGFGFLELLPAMAVRTQQGVTAVDDALVCKAVDALLKWSATQKQREKAQLLEDEQLLYVVVALKKIPDRSRTNPYRIPLPHPIYPIDGTQEICLIVSDREKSQKSIKSKEAKLKIAEEKLPIAKVIPLSKLKTDYFSFEAKRKLCGSYDLFLADDRVLPALPKLLGKTFFKKKKHPIPVTLTRAQWSGQVSAALGSTFLYIGTGTCSVVKVARISQSRDEIVANVRAVIEGVADVVPRKWRNIRALFLKTLESVALPLYQSLPEMHMKIEGRTLRIESNKPDSSRIEETESSELLLLTADDEGEKLTRKRKGEKTKVGRTRKEPRKEKKLETGA